MVREPLLRTASGRQEVKAQTDKATFAALTFGRENAALLIMIKQGTINATKQLQRLMNSTLQKRYLLVDIFPSPLISVQQSRDGTRNGG